MLLEILTEQAYGTISLAVIVPESAPSPPPPPMTPSSEPLATGETEGAEAGSWPKRGLRFCAGSGTSGRRRATAAPGERRVQILETLATMLEVPAPNASPPAALAARLEVSEAALYRHSRARRRCSRLIEFIEQSVFTLVNQIADREPDPVARCGASCTSCCSSARRTRE